MKVIKGIIISIVLLLLLVIAGVVALVTAVDPNDYKQDLEKLAAEKQVDLKIEGDLSWEFFPRVGIESGKLSVLPPGGQVTEPVSFERMNIAIKVMPLLSGEIVAANTVIEGGRLALKDEQGNTLHLNDISLNGNDLNTQKRAFPLTLSLQAVTDQPQQTVALKFDSKVVIDQQSNVIELPEGKLNVDYAGPATAQKNWPLEADVSGRLNMTESKVEFDKLVLRLFSLTAELSGQASSQGQKTFAQGTMNISITDINGLLKNLGQESIPTSDSNVLQKLVVQNHFNLNDKNLDLTDLKIQLDDTRLQGKVSALLNEVPELDVLLAGTEIDVDRYMPPQSKSDGQQKSKGEEKKEKEDNADAPLIPMDSLVALPGKYEFGMKKIKAMSLNTEDLRLSMVISKEGLVNLKTLQTKLYDGQLKVNGTVDGRQGLPVVKLSPSLSAIQVGELLKDMQQTDKPFASGDFAFNGSFVTKGQTEQELVSALNGGLEFQSNHMTLNEIDLTEALGEGLASVLKTELPGLMTEAENTVMTDLVGKAKVTNGVINNHVMKANAPCMTFSGNGKFNLPAENLLYDLGITFPSSDSTKACQEINPRLKDVAWPVQCRGKFDDDPGKLCGANKAEMEKIFKELLSKEAKRKIEKKLDEKLKEKFGEDENVKELFKGLFR